MIKILTIIAIGLLIVGGLGAVALPGFHEKINNVQALFEQQYKNLNEPLEEWNKSYGTEIWDECVAVELTVDGGYIFSGTKGANGYDNGGDCWLFKTDLYGDIEWDKTYGGQETEMGFDMCKTADGGYAVIGLTRSFGIGGIDIFLVKTDSFGNEQWSKTFGGRGDDYGLAIQESSDGCFIIAGATRSYGSNDAWLIKTDSSGTLEWDKRFCGDKPPGGYFMTVIQTIEGEYIAAGRQYHGDTSDIIVVKTDKDGNVIWEKLIGDPDCKDSVLDIAVTSDGNYILTGQVLHPETEHDIVLMKIDSNGNEIWTRNFNETPFFDTGMSVEETSDGGFLIAGEIGTNLNNPVIYDSILIKTDYNGNKEWSMIFGGEGSDGCYDAHQTTDGGYIAACFTTSFDISSQDAWILKFASFENQRPNKPLRPSGEINGKIGIEYSYTISTTDPNGDEIFYLFDWGNGMTSFILGPYNSGEECNASGIWFEKGNYEIKVKAIDIHGAESEWSDPLAVSMPRYRTKFEINILRLFDLENSRFPLLSFLMNSLEGEICKKN